MTKSKWKDFLTYYLKLHKNWKFYKQEHGVIQHIYTCTSCIQCK